MVSYNAKRAERNSKAVRDLINSAAYKTVFGGLASRDDPVSISSDNHGVSAWSLARPHSGGMVSAGVGGSVTGYEARIIIIDDPFAGREEAESAAERDRVREWYESQIYSRQQEGTAIILFHTRWHPDDLAGTLIKEMAASPIADQWEIVCLPALALAKNELPASEDEQRGLMREGIYLPLRDALRRKPGQALCPELVSQGLLEHIQANISPYNFLSLYQQMPFLRSGGFFQRRWFARVCEGLPAQINFSRAVWYWDKAATAGDGDWSVGVLMALDADRQVWVLAVSRGQWSTFERNNAMRRAWVEASLKFDRLPAAQLWHPQDPGSAGLDSARDTNKALAPIPAHFEPVTGSKEVRADPWRSALEAQNVVLLKGDWVGAFVDEHAAFPKGQHDDQVDAAASAYSKVMEGGASTLPVYVLEGGHGGATEELIEGERKRGFLGQRPTERIGGG